MIGIIGKSAVKLALISSSVSVIALSAAPAMAQQSARSFDIPAQTLSSALAEFSKQSDTLIMASREQTAGKRSRALKGSMPVNEALGRLLSGSGLRAVPNPDGGYRIERNAGNGQAVRTEATSSLGDEGAGEVEIGEIIVTAQKREQRIQDVPISISVVTADDIQKRGLVSAEDYLRGIPGVNQTGERTGAAITIRGIETSPSNQNFSSGTTVATYFGETPTTNSAGIGGGSNVDIKLVDIARVEVLRGPQGTAFGNSSLGGAVRTIPEAPNASHVEGRLSASYSRTSGTGGDNYNLQGVINLPIVADKIAIRAVGYRFEDSGYYRNVAGSDPAFQTAAAALGAQSAAVSQNEVGRSRYTGGRVAALFTPTEDLRFTLSYLKQSTRVDGEPLANTGTFEQQILQVAPEHQYRNTPEGVLDTDIDLGSALLEYDLGWSKLVATYSHIASSSRNTYPFSAIFSPGSVFPASARDLSRHRENSGEVRLVSDLDGPLNFLVGVYAERLKDRLFEDFLWNGAPAQNFFDPINGNPLLGQYVDRRRLTQKAAFGEVTYEPFTGLTLTAGVRAYDYKRTGQVDQSGPFFGLSSTSLSAKASGTSFKGNVSYKPSETALVYASWSQGFRLGKPQPGLPSTQCDTNNDGQLDGTSLSIASTRSIDSDKVDNYEIGFKVSSADRRLNLAADVFRIDWTGVPVRTSATCGGLGFAFNANAGSARSQGVELQADFKLFDTLRVYAGASWIDAELTKDAPGLLPPAFDGDRLPGSPKFNANLGVEYGFTVGGRSATVRADSIYVGRFYGDIAQSAGTRAGGYMKVDAAARVAFDQIAVELFVRNLTDRDDFTFRGPAAVGDFFGYRIRPRTIGLRADFTF